MLRPCRFCNLRRLLFGATLPVDAPRRPDYRDFAICLAYIYTNPMKGKLAARPIDWPGQALGFIDLNVDEGRNMLEVSDAPEVHTVSPQMGGELFSPWGMAGDVLMPRHISLAIPSSISEEQRSVYGL